MSRMAYRPELDGLRAVAVTAVVFSHLTPRLFAGDAGVDVFFVLSGYLITRLLTEERERSGRIDLGAFYLRRALRLYPALIVVVAVFGVAAAVDHVRYGTVAVSALFYVSNIVMTVTGHFLPPLSHTWSLAEEEQFYLLWPLLLIVGRRFPRRVAGALLAAAILASAAGDIATFGHFAQPGAVLVPRFNPLFRAHGLLLGCALALLPVHERRVPRVVAPVGLAAIVAAVVIGSLPAVNRLVPEWEMLAEIGAAAVIAGCVSGGGGATEKLLSLRPVVHVGLISYAIYLWHFPLIDFLGRHMSHRPAVLAAIVLSLVAAEISRVAVERPFLRLKARLARGEPQQPVLVPSRS